MPTKKADDDWWQGLKIVDAPRLRRMRLHLVAICELNRETWTHIRKETDDDYEWLPLPKQTDLLGLPITDEQIDRWLAMMEQWEGLLKGERLLPGNLLVTLHKGHNKKLGLNIRKVLDDPPADLLNISRIQNQGIEAKYLEAEKGRLLFDVEAVAAVLNLFGGPLGFARVLRLN